VAGEYWCWKKKPQREISADLKRCFERLGENSENDRNLRDLLGIGVSSACA